MIQNQEVNNSFVQTGNQSQQIQTQNNYYSYKTFKSLKLLNTIHINNIFANVMQFKDFIYIFISSFFISLFLCLFFISFINFFVIFFTFFIMINILFFYDFQKSKSTLIINNSSITLKTKKKIYTINFNEIRSFLKINSVYDYAFFIYKENEIQPFIKFTADIHVVNAIDELLSKKIEI